MSSRTTTLSASTSSSYDNYSSSTSSSSEEGVIYDVDPTVRRRSKSKVWVDPTSFSNCGDASQIGGNVSSSIKQLVLNTFIAYGAGDEQCFGHVVAKSVKFVDISVEQNSNKKGRMEATTTAEVTVTKGCVNGVGMLHGGCIAFLIDNCCSTPLVALGLIQNVNGVGVTQAMNVLFHSPAPLGSCIRIISTSITFGGRIMSARCEVINKDTGRVVASAYLNKMQPTSNKL